MNRVYVTRQRSSMAMPPPNTAVLPSNSNTPLAFIWVLSSVIPPPTFFRNTLVPVKMIGKRKAAIALVSLVSPLEVLLTNRLEGGRERGRTEGSVAAYIMYMFCVDRLYVINLLTITSYSPSIFSSFSSLSLPPLSLPPPPLSSPSLPPPSSLFSLPPSPSLPFPLLSLLPPSHPPPLLTNHQIPQGIQSGPHVQVKTNPQLSPHSPLHYQQTNSQ